MRGSESAKWNGVTLATMAVGTDVSFPSHDAYGIRIPSRDAVLLAISRVPHAVAKPST